VLTLLARHATVSRRIVLTMISQVTATDTGPITVDRIRSSVTTASREITHPTVARLTARGHLVDDDTWTLPVPEIMRVSTVLRSMERAGLVTATDETVTATPKGIALLVATTGTTPTGQQTDPDPESTTTGSRSPWTDAIVAYLGGDREWIARDELLAVGAAAVPSEVAVRTMTAKITRDATYRRRPAVLPDQDELIRQGARHLASQALLGLVRTGTLTRDGDQFRLSTDTRAA
jgi:hypothetical protein